MDLHWQPLSAGSPIGKTNREAQPRQDKLYALINGQHSLESLEKISGTPDWDIVENYVRIRIQSNYVSVLSIHT